jgi:glycosyltransferase involved in cell wall biosynthesis
VYTLSEVSLCSVFTAYFFVPALTCFSRCTLSDPRYRVLAVASHPVQYASPIFRRMALHPQLDFHVAYCTLRGAQAAHDPEFGATVQWDVPLLEGYDWTEVPHKGSASEGFFGLYNPGLWKLIRQGNFDAILCYAGYLRASFWITFAAARLSRSAMIFGTDASTLAPRDARPWKATLKKTAWPWLFRMADQVIVPSSAGVEMMRSLRIPPDHITLTPYAVDNDWWTAQSQQVDRASVRSGWGAPPEDAVILFCAKLQPWKRPLDLLHAFAKAQLAKALLVFAGEGPLRTQLQNEAVALGVAGRVRFLGFVNQSQLPAVYAACDLMVLPSSYEPFAVVVNEASCCGCPVAASDRVGAARDLIAPINPTLVFPCGDVNVLAQLLSDIVRDRTKLREFGRAARQRMESWSPRENISATLDAIRRAVARVRHSPPLVDTPSEPKDSSLSAPQRLSR